MLGVKPWYEAMEHGGGAGGGKPKEQCVSRDSRSLGVEAASGEVVPVDRMSLLIRY
jgi:hypothetical protein